LYAAATPPVTDGEEIKMGSEKAYESKV
jgi:hypothetical protein